MGFSLDVVVHNLPYLLAAARWTLLVSLTGMGISLVLGTGICAARISGNIGFQAFGRLYISFFRGVPLLVQLLMFYYMLPHVGLDLPATAAAILATGMCSAAYTAEILRGALRAIPNGQTEAAWALGIPGVALWRRILVPQAVRIGLPSMVNELILLVKVSSLASVVGIAELTHVSQNIASETYRPLEIYVATAMIYLVVNFALSRVGRLAEKRLRIG